MWTLFMLLLLAPLRIILSQPVVNENTRRPRQLNFEECCPCLDSGSPNNHDVFSGTMEKAATAENCPCRAAPDSESASSIFTPALSAVEPLIRSVKEKNPKPLLNPEVGLASSVLETLREVTDQEYQEALVRDAARNARNDMDENLIGQESTLNTPKNIVNIILQPKEEDTYDTIPESSRVQETRCVQPNKKSSNSFNFEKLKLSNKPLRNYSPLTTAISSKKYSDMANGASNVQEHVILPLKSNLLEDYKRKSDLLKLKLFPKVKNSFKESNTDFDKSNNLNGPHYNNNDNIHNFKLASIFDLINASKQKKNSPSTSTLKETDNNKEGGFTFSPSHNRNYYIKNNERNAVNNANSSILIREPQNFDSHLKESYTNDKSFETEYDLVDLTKPLPTPLENMNLKTNNNLAANTDIVEKKDNYNFDNIDAVSSPSEINMVKDPLDKNTDSENYLSEGCEISDDPSTIDNKDVTEDIQKPNLLNETTAEDDDEIIATNIEADNVINESNEENVCDVEDLETGASNDSLQKPNIEQENNEKISVNEPNVRENQLLNHENSLTTATDKLVTNNDLYRTHSKNALSNIKNDIFKKFEDIKKVNENIHEKLKSNIYNPLDVIKNNSYTNTETTANAPTNIIQDDEVEVDDNINTQDLQEMSDRLLNLSISNNEVEMQGFDSKDVTKTIRKADFNTSPSELNNIMMSTTSSFQSTQSTPILSDSIRSYDETLDLVDDITINKEKNDDMTVIDSLPIANPCQNDASKNLDQSEINFSNDQGNEMIAEASRPTVNSIPYTNKNFIIQPNLESENQKPNVRMLLDNFKTSLSGIFNDNRDISRNGVRHNEQPFSESRNIDTFKSISNKLTENDLSIPNKINNLNSYKAKVATPDSLQIKTVPSFRNRKESALQQTLKNIPENKGLHNYLEKPKFPQSRNTLKDYTPGLNSQNPQLTSISENLKSRTDEALKNIQDTFDDFHNSHIRNQNNILEKIPTKTNIFRTSQSKDLNKRLQEFNSDVMNRLSLMSQRIQDASILPSHESPIFQTKNKSNGNTRLKFISKPNSQVKNNILLKSGQNNGLKPKIPQPTTVLGNKSGISRTSHTMGENLRNIGETTKFKSGFETKTPLKQEYLRKPVKESKLGFSFIATSERPDIMKSRSNSKPLNKSLPPSLRSNLPKTTIPSKSPLQKRLELLSKLKPFELQPLASDRFSSRIAISDKKIDTSKLLPSSGLEETITQSVDDISEDSSKTDRFPMITKPVGNAIKIKSPNTKTNKKFSDSGINNLKSTSILDPSQSASNNMNTVVSSVVEKPLKENVSYKCKMICYEDES